MAKSLCPSLGMESDKMGNDFSVKLAAQSHPYGTSTTINKVKVTVKFIQRKSFAMTFPSLK